MGDVSTSAEGITLSTKQGSDSNYKTGETPKLKRSLSFADEKGNHLIKVTYSDKLHYSEGIGSGAKGCCSIS